jgi:hypothetical protein
MARSEGQAAYQECQRSFREPPAAADVEMSMSNILLLVLGLASAEFLGQAPHQLHAAAPRYRYFKVVRNYRGDMGKRQLRGENIRSGV